MICEKCGGSGHVLADYCKYVAGMWDTQECQYCRGTGEVNDPREFIDHTISTGPWLIVEGSPLLICAGDDPDKPGEMLFALRAPVGPSWAVDERWPNRILAEYAAYIVGIVNDYHKIQAELKQLRKEQTYKVRNP